MRVPKYRRNPDGRAFVQVNKKRFYLGTFDTPESKKAYRDFIAQLMGRPELPPTASAAGLTVSELAMHYLAHAESYYGDSGEFRNVSVAVTDFVKLFATEAGPKLGPLHLLKYQEALVSGGYARKTINARLSRVKRCLKWCASRQLIEPAIYHGACTVDGLRAGRSDATELPPVQPVPLATVETTLKYVAPVVAAMARTQYLCGMRPSEVCRMRLVDIDRSGDVWIYRPADHKNTWRGKVLVKAIPAAAQKILTPWLTDDLNAWIFTPAASVEWWAQQTRKKKARRKPAKASRRYTSCTYGKAIGYGVKRANRAGEKIADWSPNQLRHSIAGELSRKLGQQAAQRWLGHARLDTTAIYAQLNADELVGIAKALEEIESLAAGE